MLWLFQNKHADGLSYGGEKQFLSLSQAAADGEGRSLRVWDDANFDSTATAADTGFAS